MSPLMLEILVINLYNLIPILFTNPANIQEFLPKNYKIKIQNNKKLLIYDFLLL